MPPRVRKLSAGVFFPGRRPASALAAGPFPSVPVPPNIDELLTPPHLLQLRHLLLLSLLLSSSFLPPALLPPSLEGVDGEVSSVVLRTLRGRQVAEVADRLVGAAFAGEGGLLYGDPGDEGDEGL